MHGPKSCFRTRRRLTLIYQLVEQCGWDHGIAAFFWQCGRLPLSTFPVPAKNALFLGNAVKTPGGSELSDAPGRCTEKAMTFEHLGKWERCVKVQNFPAFPFVLGSEFRIDRMEHMQLSRAKMHRWPFCEYILFQVFEVTWVVLAALPD